MGYCRSCSPFICSRWLRLVIPVTFLLLLSLYFYPHLPNLPLRRKAKATSLFPDTTGAPPLAGCFASRAHPDYNVTESLYGKKKTQIHSALPVHDGFDCHYFAGTIHPPSGPRSFLPGDQRIQYHTYWRSDIREFGEKQEWFIKSFLATQNTNTSRLIIWSNGDLTKSPTLKNYLDRVPDSVIHKIANRNQLAVGTALEDSPFLEVEDGRAWVDGDLLRLQVLWHYGGVWVDLDTLLTRDLEPLLDHEFMTEWSCQPSARLDEPPFNGALMAFCKGSSYLCEAFHIMANSDAPRIDSTDWGAAMYIQLYRRLLAAGIRPFESLPWCFSEGRTCWRYANDFPEPFWEDDAKGWRGLTFEAGGHFDKLLSNIFAIHVHGRWDYSYPAEGWAHRLLLDRFDDKVKDLLRNT